MAKQPVRVAIWHEVKGPEMAGWFWQAGPQEIEHGPFPSVDDAAADARAWYRPSGRVIRVALRN